MENDKLREKGQAMKSGKFLMPIVLGLLFLSVVWFTACDIQAYGFREASKRDLFGVLVTAFLISGHASAKRSSLAKGIDVIRWILAVLLCFVLFF
jgi:hypothetical protein